MSEYNTDLQYLEAAIKSILRQTFSEFEFIIVDDSGKHNLEKYILRFNDPRIRVIDNKKNMGLVYSLNEALNASRGRYVVRMDTDDIAYPDRIYKQLNFIKKNPQYSVVSSRAIEFDDIADQGVLGKSGEKLKYNISRGDSLIHPSVIMKRNEILKVGGYDYFDRAEDLGLWLKLLANGKRLYVMDDVLIRYRVNSRDYTKRRILNRKGEISARLYYYPKLNVGFLPYLIIIKSLIAGLLPIAFVRWYRKIFILKSAGATK
jgi:glycosyltransferase EpsE